MDSGSSSAATDLSKIEKLLALIAEGVLMIAAIYAEENQYRGALESMNEALGKLDELESE